MSKTSFNHFINLINPKYLLLKVQLNQDGARLGLHQINIKAEIDFLAHKVQNGLTSELIIGHVSSK